MAQAEANKALMKGRPRVLSGPHPELPEDERTAGHNGTVLVEGIADAEGNFAEVHLRQSSGAPVLDALALDAARKTRFTPATDANGRPIAVPVTMPFEFYTSQSSEPGGGLVHYNCEQFVRDTDWWRSVHSDAKWDDYKLYKFMVGFAIIANPNKDAVTRFKAGRAVADQWAVWIDSCRAHPDQLFVDQTGPLASGLHALAKWARKKAR